MSLTGFLLQSTPQALPSWYDRLAGQLLAPIHQQISARAAQCFRESAVLDYGTGTGRLPPLLLEQGVQGPVTAVDVSDNMLMFAEDRAREASVHQRIRFGLQESTGFPFPGEVFELVICCCVLHCEERQPVALLDRLHDLLAVGGECWLLEVIRSDEVTEKDFLRGLREARLVSRWLPDFAVVRGLKSMREHLLTSDQVVDHITQSRFGLATQVEHQALTLGSVSVAEGILWWTLKRPEFTAP